jgi:hypothetical protein
MIEVWTKMRWFLLQKSILKYLQLIIFWNLYNKNFRLCLTTSFFLQFLDDFLVHT